MSDTLFLAQVFGFYLIIVGFAVIIRHEYIKELVKDFISSPAHIFIAGLFTTVLGLLLVLKHNIWQGDIVGVITIISWLTLLKGIYYMWTPHTMFKKIIRWTNTHNWYIGSGIISVVLGIYLISAGFSWF